MLDNHNHLEAHQGSWQRAKQQLHEAPLAANKDNALMMVQDSLLNSYSAPDSALCGFDLVWFGSFAWLLAVGNSVRVQLDVSSFVAPKVTECGSHLVKTNRFRSRSAHRSCCILWLLPYCDRVALRLQSIALLSRLPSKAQSQTVSPVALMIANAHCAYRMSLQDSRLREV